MASMLSTAADVDDSIFNRFMASDQRPERERKRRLSEEVDERLGTASRVLSPTSIVSDDYFGSTATSSTAASDWGSGAAAHPAPADGGKSPSSAADDPTKDVWQVRLSNICFLLLGIGVAVAWTSLRAGIAYFSTHFELGPSFYNILQIAYNVPVLPLLVLQTLYDERFDTRFGTRRAYVFRLVVSMVIMTGCLLIVLPKTQALVLVAAALVGVTDAAAFGAATQLFSMFPPVAGGLYFTGASLTSLISIALTFATGFEAADAASSSLTAFYICAALFILVGLAGALLLVNSRIGRHYLNAKDQELATAERARKSVVGPGGLSGKNSASETENSARLSQPPLEALHKARAARASETGEGTIDHRPLLGADAAEDADASRLTLAADSSASSTTASGAAPADSVLLAPPTIMTNKQLFLLTFSCHAALFLGWFATNTVDSLIAFVPSQKDTPAGDNQGFRLVMLYCSLGGELLGKQLNIARRGRILKTPRGLLVAVGVRTLFVLPFLLYILQPRFTADGAYNFRSDGLIATFQVLFDASGSYLSTLTYSMAAALLPSSALRAQSSTLLSLTLMMGVYVGLGVSLAIARSLSDLPRTAFA